MDDLVCTKPLASIRDFMELGGDVLWAIMFVLFLMWTFILERLWYFYRVHPEGKQRNRITTGSPVRIPIPGMPSAFGKA